MWDKDVDTTNEARMWKDGLSRKGNQLPWLILSDGKQGYEGPLPNTMSETMAILRKFGE